MKSEILKPLAFIVLFAAGSIFLSWLFSGSATRVIGSESSAGTWLSGVLLVMSATIAMAIAIRSNSNWWFFIVLFFLILAADERFMFHERAKHFLLFRFQASTLPSVFFELPVLIGAVVGGVICFSIWKRSATGRRLLVIGAGVGLSSVVVDVLSASIVLEEILKLIAELIILAALVLKFTEIAS